jgi:hypothetical protein
LSRVATAASTFPASFVTCAEREDALAVCETNYQSMLGESFHKALAFTPSLR